VPFGTNANNGPVRLTFSQQCDEAGDPYFERIEADRDDEP
jgi:hypothetical protein